MSPDTYWPCIGEGVNGVGVGDDGLADPPHAASRAAVSPRSVVQRAWGNGIGARREYLSGGRFPARSLGGSGIILTMTVGILANSGRGASHRHTSDPSAPPAASFSMRVSSKAHYGLRMMTEFAKAYGAGPLSIAEVARVEHLPLAYLEQLAAQLRRGGLVESTRGVHGGYALTRPADQISVLEVVTVLEGEE